jgi:hypothetical protein
VTTYRRSDAGPVDTDLLSAFPRLGTSGTGPAPDGVGKLLLNHTRLTAQHPHQRVTRQTGLRRAMRQPDLTTTGTDLHDDLGRIARITHQPVTKPNLRRLHPHLDQQKDLQSLNAPTHT